MHPPLAFGANDYPGEHPILPLASATRARWSVSSLGRWSSLVLPWSSWPGRWLSARSLVARSLVARSWSWWPVRAGASLESLLSWL